MPVMLLFLSLGHLVLKICFEFRDSDFVFCQCDGNSKRWLLTEAWKEVHTWLQFQDASS
jgi:hypothetical protein